MTYLIIITSLFLLVNLWVGIMIWRLSQKVNPCCDNCKMVAEQCDEICNLNNLLDDKNKEIENLKSGFMVVKGKIGEIKNSLVPDKIILTDERKVPL